MIKTLRDIKVELRQKATPLWPNVPFPEVCFVFETQLGIDPKTVILTPFSKDYYYAFLLDENGVALRNKADRMFIRRKILFTREQRAILDQWWPALPDELKIYGN